jgi:hypothetical protein
MENDINDLKALVDQLLLESYRQQSEIVALRATLRSFSAQVLSADDDKLLQRLYLDILIDQTNRRLSEIGPAMFDIRSLINAKLSFQELSTQMLKDWEMNFS